MPPPYQHVIWVRCADPTQLEQVATIEGLLRMDGEAVRFLCTLSDPEGTEALQTPNGPRDVRKFIFAHRPIALIWFGGILDQGSLAPCFAVDLPVIILEGSERMLSRIMGSWMPHRARTTLTKLHAVFAIEERAQREFIAGGAPEDVIQVSGSIGDANTVLSHREDDRVELAQALGTRPVWLATSVSTRDTGMLCEAHKEAARRAHRLLLVIAPKRQEDGPEIAAQCSATGLNTSMRSTGAEPEEATQIYIADDDDGMGLWYRIAPVTYLGGTFGEGAADDPYHAAALGSVSMHGPAHGAFALRFKNLVEAQATVQLNHPDDLGEAVAQLLAVDKAAALANAGWDVTSRGAGAATLVAATIQALIDDGDF